MRVLESYVCGRWHTPPAGGTVVLDATTGEAVV